MHTAMADIVHCALYCSGVQARQPWATLGRHKKRRDELREQAFLTCLLRLQPISS